jgi:hypothetical protein
VRLGDECKVTTWEWLIPYAGETYSDPSEADIDHGVVPLANAGRSRASSWDQDLRWRYTNAPDVLLTVDSGANRSNAEEGPEARKPPGEGASDATRSSSRSASNLAMASA